MTDINKFIIKIKSGFRDKNGKWVETSNDYMKAEGKILLFNKDFPNKKIKFEIISEDQEYLTIKATIDGYGSGNDIQVHSEGISKISKTVEVKGGSKVENIKYTEKAQTIALGKALSYLGYGLEYGLNTAEEMQDYVDTDKNIPHKAKINVEKYYSELSKKEIKKNEYNYSTQHAGYALSFEEQKQYAKIIKDNPGLENAQYFEKLKEEFRIKNQEK